MCWVAASSASNSCSNNFCSMVWLCHQYQNYCLDFGNFPESKLTMKYRSSPCLENRCKCDNLLRLLYLHSIVRFISRNLNHYEHILSVRTFRSKLKTTEFRKSYLNQLNEPTWAVFCQCKPSGYNVSRRRVDSLVPHAELSILFSNIPKISSRTTQNARQSVCCLGLPLKFTIQIYNIISKVPNKILAPLFIWWAWLL